MAEVVAKKKREPKAGTRRVTVTLSQSEYDDLVTAAEKQMREPNNLLSFILKDQIARLIADSVG